VLRVPVGRTFAIAPAAAAGLFALGGAMVWYANHLNRHREKLGRWLILDKPMDGLYRTVDLRGLTNGQLQHVQRQMQGQRNGYVRDPLTGVIVSQEELNAEFLRRSGQGGFLFVPPPVGGVVAASLANALRIAAVGAVAWLVAKLGLDWGGINSPGLQYGPGGTLPDWWPTGTLSPNAYNPVTITWKRTRLNEYDGCKELTESYVAPGFTSWGTSPIWVSNGDEKFSQNSCGVVPPASVIVTGGGQNGTKGELMRIGTNTDVSEIKVESITVTAGDPATAVSYPDWTPSSQPRRFPQIEPVPALPQPATIPLPLPEPLPAEVPDAVPLGVPGPANPGQIKKAPPRIGVPGRPGQGNPVRIPGAVDIGVGGVPTPAPIPLPVTTPTDQEIPWPGADPIGSPGQQPRPTMQGIAQEVGRLEQKMRLMNTPGKLAPGQPPSGLGDLIEPLWGLIQGMLDAGGYELSSRCVPDGEPGSPSDPLTWNWGPSLTPFAGLENRLGAIAGMLQGSKDLPQPTCKGPRVEGEWVSINFESIAPSPQGQKRLRKIFRYRDQQAQGLESHVDHWRDFTWQAGDVIVVHKGGVWGVPKVWAASVDEGKRVIRHAAAIAGVDLEAPGSQWVVSRSGDPRYGMAGEMQIMRGRDGLWMISKRDGPSGPAQYLAPG
jgi:hypothetical protein